MSRSLSALALAALAALPQPAAAGQAARAVRLDRAYLIGLWTDDGNCRNAVEFARDGRFINPNGTVGQWLLDGDRLTLTGERRLRVRLRLIDRDRVDIVNEDGSLGHSTRCASRLGEDAPVVNDVT